MKYASSTDRRDFLKITAAGSLAVALAACNRDSQPTGPATAAAANNDLPPLPNTPATPTAATSATPATAAAAAPAKVAVTTGSQRSDNIARALKSIENDIKQALANRRIIIKPNTTSATNQLASTHADALVPILDFLKSLGKLPYTAIAESSAATIEAFHNFGYDKLAAKYNVKLIDLDNQKSENINAFSQADARPHPVRVSSVLKDQSHNFIISVTPPKTHDRAVCTLGLKNVVFGAALKTGPNPGNNKAVLHGDGPRGININLAMLAQQLHPALTVIDGFEGMEGDGPLGGTKVDHKVAFASLDFLAADVVGATLMGINPADVGYLYFLSTTNIGIADITKMEILGESLSSVTKKYKLHSTIQEQLQWKNPARVVSN